MRTLKNFCSLCLVILMLFSCADNTVPLKVLQLNVWMSCTKVPDATNHLVSTIQQADPDVIFLCEAGDKQLIVELQASLKEKGMEYYGEHVGMGTVVLSKYSFKDLHPKFTQDRWGAKAILEVGGQTISLYSMHLDYLHYECYMPRGYNGYTWEKMEAPATNADTVLAANRLSQRDEYIAHLIEDAKKDIEQGNLVILGGDFNEPSHLDWQADTKDMRDHNGLVINWDCSVMLQKAGYIDSYRQLYPDPVTHPGFTFAAGNKDADIKSLAWTEGVDDRDRIDFVYYMPNENIQLKDARIVGPVEDLYKGKLVDGKTEDVFFTPKGGWPTDHKGNLVTFTIRKK